MMISPVSPSTTVGLAMSNPRSWYTRSVTWNRPAYVLSWAWRHRLGLTELGLLFACWKPYTFKSQTTSPEASLTTPSKGSMSPRRATRTRLDHRTVAASAPRRSVPRCARSQACRRRGATAHPMPRRGGSTGCTAARPRRFRPPAGSALGSKMISLHGLSLDLSRFSPRARLARCFRRRRVRGDASRRFEQPRRPSCAGIGISDHTGGTISRNDDCRGSFARNRPTQCWPEDDAVTAPKSRASFARPASNPRS